MYRLPYTTQWGRLQTVGPGPKSYETLMEGSIYGPAIVPGNSRKSPVNILVEGRAGNLTSEMKMRHIPITDHEIKTLHLWVEQGAQNN